MLQTVECYSNFLPQKSGRNSSVFDLGDARCGHGDLNEEALQQVIAAKWAVDVINAQSGPQDLKIGKSMIEIGFLH